MGHIAVKVLNIFKTQWLSITLFVDTLYQKSVNAIFFYFLTWFLMRSCKGKEGFTTSIREIFASVMLLGRYLQVL